MGSTGRIWMRKIGATSSSASIILGRRDHTQTRTIRQVTGATAGVGWCCSPPLVTFLSSLPFSSSARQQQQQQQQRQQEPPPVEKTQGLVSILEHEHLLDKIPMEDVRNFCFISHIDHGKSSLSSRLLELTGNLGPEAQHLAWAHVHQTYTGSDEERMGGDNSNTNSSRSSSTTSATNATIADGNNSGGAPFAASSTREQIELFDTLAVEQQRGITVKASTATMLYRHPSAVGPEGVLLLHLYDTPGHVDFGREVSRSLSFVQGAVLLLDATQGIQAQTWSVVEKSRALPNPPVLLIALTKVDLPSARPIHVALTVSEWLDYDDPDDIMLTSARNRIGIKSVLDAVCERVPPPKPLPDDKGEKDPILRAQVIDSWFDDRGVNCSVQIVSGTLKESDRISIVSSGPNASNTGKSESFSVQEVGIILPKLHRTGKLVRGQMGYVRFGLRDPRQAMPGTVLIWNSYVGEKDMILPETPPGSETKSVLYASVHPDDVDGFEELSNAVERLALNDTGLEVTRTSSLGSAETGGPFLGPGLRVGFQGLLHAEVFRQRLLDEFGVDAVVTPPKVPYQVTFLPNKKFNITEEVTKVVEDLSEWPEPGVKHRIMEPIVDARIIARVEDAGAVMDLISRKRGTELQTKPIDEEKWLFTARLPWAEVVTDFHDQLKNTTAGYGSLDTSEADPPFAEAKLSKIEFVLNGEAVEPLAFVCHKDVAYSQAKAVCDKLHDVLPRQQFVTIIQAKADGKVIASKRIQAFRKDVLVKSGKVVGGGDQTRKKKLLEKQKKGKKRLQSSGKVMLSQAAFNSVISRSS